MQVSLPYGIFNGILVPKVARGYKDDSKILEIVISSIQGMPNQGIYRVKQNLYQRSIFLITMIYPLMPSTLPGCYGGPDSISH
jgi:hypothetical protein